MGEVKRVFIIVMDSFGIGHAPDAAEFGDEGSNTLETIRKSPKFYAPNLEKLGLFRIDGVEPAMDSQGCPDQSDTDDICRETDGSARAAAGRDTAVVFPAAGSYGRLQELSRGKDTTTGHWEIAGIVSEKPMPVYPNGFPEEILERLEQETGRGSLCNLPYSGTEVIAKYGEEQARTGKWILYTSADSVMQIAAHEEIIPLEELYDGCRKARAIMQGKHAVGRIIARPYIGEPGNYTRTKHRHDFSLVPEKTTMMDVLAEHGLETLAVGKINDIFAGKSISGTVSISGNQDGMIKAMEYQKQDFHGLCFINLVDFDMEYGHRNDVDGYAEAVTVFDVQLGEFMNKMREDDVLMITGDHGCDPGYPGTDHTRECVPVLICGKHIRQGVNLGTRSGFADIAATVLQLLEMPVETCGTGFAAQILC